MLRYTILCYGMTPDGVGASIYIFPAPKKYIFELIGDSLGCEPSAKDSVVNHVEISAKVQETEANF